MFIKRCSKTNFIYPVDFSITDKFLIIFNPINDQKQKKGR